MITRIVAAIVVVFGSLAQGGEFRIESASKGGQITWSGAFTAGVCTVETSGVVPGGWVPRENYFTSNTLGGAKIQLSPSNTFCRLKSVDISTNSPDHYTNLLQSYGLLETIAGKGEFSGDHVNYWLPSYEGGWATNANLSRPHIAFGDPHGNVIIVDQGSSSVLKVTPEGRIYTYAGTHVAGNNGDGPDYATNLNLNFPNGGWMRDDGTFYVLDTENGKLRRIDTNQIMTTMFTTTPMGDGRALWVKSDESLAYFGSGAGVGANVTVLNKWTPSGGLSVVSSSFLNLGNILGNEDTGDLYISDRNAYRVYRMDTNGTLTTIAGNGTATGSGGEGSLATQTSLNLPRSVWFIPNGGFFVGEHDPGNRVWYIDPAGIIHRWLNGSGTATTYGLGDGQWFYANPNLPKANRLRSVVTDFSGNLIITESNNGYIRRIRFQRMTP